MSHDTEQSQQSPREIAEKLHRKIKRFIDADRHHYEPSGLYEIVTWIADAIESERESLAAKDREIAELRSLVRDVYAALGPRENPTGDIDDDLRNVAQAHSGSLLSIAALQTEIAAERKKFAWIGQITQCPDCDGSGKNAHGDCCRIPGHARDCRCAICQWKNAHYRQSCQIAALQDESLVGTNLFALIYGDYGDVREFAAEHGIKEAGEKAAELLNRERAERVALQEETASLKDGALQEAYLNLSSDYSKLEKQRDALAEALKNIVDASDTSAAINEALAALASVDEQKQQEPGK